MMNDTRDPELKLTAFAHGGGCGCKVGPGLLAQILGKGLPAMPVPKELLVGLETSDDAAVYQINEHQALVATIDFFTPIVDDPFDFGRIAATNALSDVYAMGARPLLALAVVGMPIDRLPAAVIARILEGGQAVCASVGIPIAGGHTIDTAEPIYGLVVIGLVVPDQIKRNSGALAGDQLILGKPLGVGVMTAAIKRGELDAAGYQRLLAQTTQLNTPGQHLGAWPGVHALTDVTGFGLLGNLLEVCRGARLTARIEHAAIPLIPGSRALLERGNVTGASRRNWEAYGDAVDFVGGIEPAWQALLTDPQTSGGLLVACKPASVEGVLALFRAEGFADVAVIGTLESGPARVRVT
jgi:selenide,water dikinase